MHSRRRKSGNTALSLSDKKVDALVEERHSHASESEDTQRRRARDVSLRSGGPEQEDLPSYDAEAEPLDAGYASTDRIVTDPTERSTLGGTGASLAPEELGQQALAEATQQTSGDEAAARGRLDSEGLVGDDDAPRGTGGPRELDLTDNVVREESLFDIPFEDGSIRSPRLKTNEVDAGLDRDARARRSAGRGSRLMRKSSTRSR